MSHAYLCVRREETWGRRVRPCPRVVDAVLEAEGPSGDSDGSAALDALLGVLGAGAGDGAVEAAGALGAVAAHPRGAAALAAHGSAVARLVALLPPPHPAALSAAAALVLRQGPPEAVRHVIHPRHAL